MNSTQEIDKLAAQNELFRKSLLVVQRATCISADASLTSPTRQIYDIVSELLEKENLSTRVLLKRDAKTINTLADKLEAKNLEYAHEVGYHEPDTGAFVVENEYAELTLEVTDDIIEFIRSEVKLLTKEEDKK